MILEHPFLSICIPTYNRCEKTFSLVKNILNFQGTDIEVVVLDNCSTDNTKVLLESISDIRFRYVCNSSNIGGILNPMKALTYAKGEFCVLCLDKDFIKFEGISEFIKGLKEDTNISFGYCALNIDKKTSNKIFNDVFGSLKNMCYSSKHPSGYFFNTNLYKNSTTLSEIFANPKVFGFYFEVVNAELALKGNSVIINVPLFFTETREECAKTISHTYSKGNLYFEPKGRIDEFDVYLKNCDGLIINRKIKLNILSSLYFRGLFASTISYKSIMLDKMVCIHHGIQPTKIGFIELIHSDIEFSKAFLDQPLSISYIRKLSIIFMGHFKGIMFLLLNKIRK